MSSLLRRVYASITLGASMVLAIFMLAVPAAQAETYRYWSYWHATDGSWTLSTEGSGQHIPKDGTVEGWRFIKSGGGQAPKPRPEPSFESICATTAPKEGMKRVAVVIDYGTAKAAPQGAHPPVKRAECARVPTDADGNEVLAAVASERYGDSGMVCSIDGYPQGACGASESGTSSGSQEDGTQDAASSDASTSGAAGGGNGTGSTGGAADTGSTAGTGSAEGARSASSSDSGGGVPVGAVAGVAVGGLLVGVLGGAAVLRTRRAR